MKNTLKEKEEKKKQKLRLTKLFAFLITKGIFGKLTQYHKWEENITKREGQEEEEEDWV